MFSCYKCGRSNHPVGGPLCEVCEPDKTRQPQVACANCTQGVMDYHNPHLWGGCQCPCHTKEQSRGQA